MNYYCYEITCTPEQAEWLPAVISDIDFDSFTESETGIEAYIPERLHTTDTEQLMQQKAEQFNFKFEKKFIPYKNWNAVWESNFEPIEVDDFVYIHADFHPKKEGFEHSILIQPKMAFGTGHHETTYMMMQIMRSLDFKNKSVFDYGCGTGILAILAAMRGANDLDAVDIELPSYENTIENAEINTVTGIQAFHGILEDVPQRTYDIILANINRNVIIPSLPELYKRLETNGNLLISGFIKEDENLMEEKATENKFIVVRTERRGNWICQQLQKTKL